MKSCYKFSSKAFFTLLNNTAGNIEHLDISYTDISFGLKSNINKIRKLKSLNLSECSLIKDLSLLKILKSCGTNLSILKLNCTNINGKNLTNSLMKFTKLANLELAGCSRISNTCFTSILSQICSSIKHLNLSFTNVSTFDFGSKVQFEKLVTLMLNGCEKLTEEGLAGKHCFSVAYLFFRRMKSDFSQKLIFFINLQRWFTYKIKFISIKSKWYLYNLCYT